MASHEPDPPRRVRADAQRNRTRILDVAKQLFARDGDPASMDEISRVSGVGPGTLYRHFPNREALIEAVYINEVEKLAGAEAHFAQTMPPLQALRAWMFHFIDHVAGKKLILPAMNTVPGGAERLLEGARAPVQTAFRTSVQRAIASGDLHANTNPDDFVRALIGVFHTTAAPGWEDSARRIADLLIAGAQS